MAKFPIQITAEDKTRGALDKIGKAFEQLSKGSSFERLSKGFGSWAKSGASIGDAWKAIGSLGDRSAAAAGGLGEAAEGASALGLAVGGAALGLGAIAIGLEKAGEWGIKFSAGLAQASASLVINARLIDTTTQDLQRFQGAAELSGLKSSDATAAMLGLAGALHSSEWNGRNDVAAEWSTLGLKLKHLKDGSIDTTASLIDLSRVLQRYNGDTQVSIAEKLGVTSLLPLLQQGPDAIKRLFDQVDRSGAVLTDHQKTQFGSLNTSLAKLGLAFDGLKNKFAEKFVVPWVQPLVDQLSKLVNWLGKGLDVASNFESRLKEIGTFLGAPAKLGASLSAHLLSLFGGGPGPNSSSPAKAAAGAGAAPAAKAGRGGAIGAGFLGVQRFFESQGWTRQQAAGIAANARGESSFDPHAVNPFSRMFGLFQWDRARRNNFAKLFGHDIYSSSMSEQLRFAQYELTQGGEQAAGAALRRAKSAMEAARVINDLYERNGLPSAGVARGRFAERALAGEVNVNIQLAGAPAGTVVKTNSSKNVRPSVKIGHAMATGAGVA